MVSEPRLPKILRYYLDDSMALVPHGAGGSSSVSLAYPLLSSTNYTAWAIKVEAILDSQGLWEAVRPAEGEAVDTRKDKTARAQLLQALPEDILLQVSQKKTAKELWDSLKTRFVGADRVKAARLSTLKGEFDFLRMKEGESLDDYAGKISGMAARYVNLGATLDDAAMVKKLLDTVPDRLYPAVAGIEQFCDVEKMPFEEALGRLKAFEERSRRRTQASETGDGQLLLTAAEWQNREKLTSPGKKGKCYKCGVRGHFARECPNPKKDEALLAMADDEPTLL